MKYISTGYFGNIFAVKQFSPLKSYLSVPIMVVRKVKEWRQRKTNVLRPLQWSPRNKPLSIVQALLVLFKLANCSKLIRIHCVLH